MALKPKTRQLIWSLVTLVVLAALTAFINSQGGSGLNSAGTSASASSEVADTPRTGADPESGLAWISPGSLPPEARQTLAQIAAGGPYPFPRNDDQTFGNREGILPERPHGYYREYTVITPGSDDRGARRVVAGERGELYYTDDHYDSFRRVGEAG